MEQIKIIFYALATFFGIEGGRIAADTTEVSIYPHLQTIEIVQKDIFTIIQSEKDSTTALTQWHKIAHRIEKEVNYDKELEVFSTKSSNIISTEKEKLIRLSFKYLKPEDLNVFGIGYRKEKNQFSISNIPQHHIKTKDGVIEGNYLVFNANETIKFTLEPFLQMPEKYKTHKRYLKDFVSTKN